MTAPGLPRSRVISQGLSERDFHRRLLTSMQDWQAGSRWSTQRRREFFGQVFRSINHSRYDTPDTTCRMYSSTFSDWFCQAVIDFMLGNRTLSVFSEFLLKLQSTDPRELIRLSKIRAEAIATCSSRVLPEEERMQCGWTLFAPQDLNTKMGEKFEEKILLLVCAKIP